jgi:hypothetical protein
MKLPEHEYNDLALPSTIWPRLYATYDDTKDPVFAPFGDTISGTFSHSVLEAAFSREASFLCRCEIRRISFDEFARLVGGMTTVLLAASLVAVPQSGEALRRTRRYLL